MTRYTKRFNIFFLELEEDCASALLQESIPKKIYGNAVFFALVTQTYKLFMSANPGRGGIVLTCSALSDVSIHVSIHVWCTLHSIIMSSNRENLPWYVLSVLRH